MFLYALVSSPAITPNLFTIGFIPTNIAIMCPLLADPANGSVLISGNSIGETADYICELGFTLVGPSSLTCGEDGSWSGIPPVCIGKPPLHTLCTPMISTITLLIAVICPLLLDPANGTVVMSGNMVGDAAIYTCDPGFSLVGESRLTCASNGTWSGIPPVCTRKKNLIPSHATNRYICVYCWCSCNVPSTA